MLLYKYGAAVRAQSLAARRLRFTQPIHFNDPFELAPSIDGLVGSAHEEALLRQAVDVLRADPVLGRALYESALQKFEALLGLPLRRIFPFDESLRLALPDGPGEDPTLVRQVNERIRAAFYDDLRDRIATAVGVLSLSEVPDSLLMWAHYADEHRGFALGFDGGHRFFDRTLHGPDVARALRPVTYSERRPRRYLAAYLEDPEYLFESLAQDFYLTKSLEWSYEREWRMLLPASDADEAITAGGQTVLLLSYPPEALREVVLGARCPPDCVEAVCAVLSGPEYRHVRIVRAVLDPDRFALRLEHQR
jgi:hypothetical protein